MSGSATWFHLSVKAIGRSAGRSVVAAAAYRLGKKLHDKELDQTHDYTRRHGVHSCFTLAPEQAPDWALKPDELWNNATGAEKRKNSILAREVELALPALVTDEKREEIVRQFAQTLVDRYGVAVSAAIHQPSRYGDQQNHHAHILFTTREVGENGLGKKTRVLDVMTTGSKEIFWLRGHAAYLINAALEDAGSGEHVDHRSYAARGIEKEATQHLGPEATEMERRGKVTELGDANREVIWRNQQHGELSAELVDLVNELAELDAEIVAVKEQRLDALYGQAEPLPVKECGAAREALPLASPAPAPIDAFDLVRNRTIARAKADDVGHDGNLMEKMGGRIARISKWWQNMRAYVAGWRDEIQRHAEHLLAPWEKEEMQEQAHDLDEHTPQHERGQDR